MWRAPQLFPDLPLPSEEEFPLRLHNRFRLVTLHILWLLLMEWKHQLVVTTFKLPHG
jgi:hypothetical protein